MSENVRTQRVNLIASARLQGGEGSKSLKISVYDPEVGTAA